ncbi:MAG: helix-turn-helix domain-containing protein [Roseiflexaceae bacterium]|nr:helix-turn-helix domain-containing protein [Roseiflexaceae bacterium]
MTDLKQPTALVEPLLVRVEEAARMLSLSRSTIYEMMDAGDLPSVRHGTARRIPVAALRDWVVQQTQQSGVSK